MIVLRVRRALLWTKADVFQIIVRLLMKTSKDLHLLSQHLNLRLESQELDVTYRAATLTYPTTMRSVADVTTDTTSTLTPTLVRPLVTLQEDLPMRALTFVFQIQWLADSLIGTSALTATVRADATLFHLE